jgi:hypothetical protein
MTLARPPIRVPHISPVFGEMWEEYGSFRATLQGRSKLKGFGWGVVKFPTSRQNQARYGAPGLVAGQES